MNASNGQPDIEGRPILNVAVFHLIARLQTKQTSALVSSNVQPRVSILIWLRRNIDTFPRTFMRRKACES